MPEAGDLQPVPEPTQAPEITEVQKGLQQKTAEFFTKHRMTIMWGGASVGGVIVPALSSGAIEIIPIMAAIGLGLGALYDRRENNAKREGDWDWQDENLMDNAQKPHE
jgi:hypothetical protein